MSEEKVTSLNSKPSYYYQLLELLAKIGTAEVDITYKIYETKKLEEFTVFFEGGDETANESFFVYSATNKAGTLDYLALEKVQKKLDKFLALKEKEKEEDRIIKKLRVVLQQLNEEEIDVLTKILTDGF